MDGQGSYGDICAKIVEKTGARGVIVIVIEGEKGSGCYTQTEDDLLPRVPDVLEKYARQWREEHGNESISDRPA